ncbi:hypothetical protein V1460_17985 [Streptomyces sp. SCSIO 30461]|uniref:hypothetical protein n=1 Tax=Streptomyces sp. SCSIO 30461 TaxID=3118085 RepID=UPI0030CDE63C
MTERPPEPHPWNGADLPGRVHDQTAARAESIAEQLRLHPKVKAEDEVNTVALAP